LSVVDLVLNEFLWIPVGLLIGFIVIKYQKFTKRKQPKQRGYYGGEGYLSSFPDENTDRQLKNRDRNS